MIDWFMDDLSEAAHGLYWPVVEVLPQRALASSWLFTTGIAAALAATLLYSRSFLQ